MTWDEPAPYQPLPAAVSAGFRRLVLEKYPALAAPGERAHAYRRVMQYVLFSTYAEEDTGFLILPYETMAALVGVRPGSRGFSAGGWMEAFSRDVGLPLDPGGYRYVRGQARTIRPRVHPEVRAALRRECGGGSGGNGDEGGDNGRGGGGRVWFVSGERVSRRGERAARREYEARLEALCRSSVGPGHPARAVVEHFLNTPQDCLGRVLKRNLPLVRAAVAALAEGTEPERATRQWCERLLVTMGYGGGGDGDSGDSGGPGGGATPPKMFYAGSPKTPRVFAAGASVHQLPRRLRQIAFAGCYECDLRAAQLAVVARLWDIPPLQAFLQGGGSIWGELATAAGVPVGEYKPLLKRTVYSVVFGMSRKNLRAQLAQGTGVADQEPGVGDEAADRVLGHPLMRALLGARARASRRVWKERGARDAWGTWVATAWEFDEGRGKPVQDVPSVLARVVQSYELRLLLPVLGVARAEEQVYLLSWLHDGVTVHLGNQTKAGRHLRKLAGAVRGEAERLGMATALEVKRLPTAREVKSAYPEWAGAPCAGSAGDGSVRR